MKYYVIGIVNVDEPFSNVTVDALESEFGPVAA